MKSKTKLCFLLQCCFHFIDNPEGYGQYFQQEVNYSIQVRLNDSKHELNGYESFEYVNHSPDILTEIYIHLWPNAYKNKNTALSQQDLQNGDAKIYFAEEKDRGFIDSLAFKADGKDVQWIMDSVNIDICKIILNTPLHPGERTTISTPFHVKIPSGKLSRMGHIGQAYAISQWYPKPAVYDRKGWHPMPYLNQGEFYSEFGSFEVHITVPKNYVVGATGDLQNEEELAWLSGKAAETEAMTTFDKSMNFPASEMETKTLVFKQKQVHDFAWFADKRFHVLKGSVELPHTGEKVTTWALFTNSEPLLWKNGISYINNTLYYYSLWNGDYAYKNYTAVDGTISAGGGMEYPNITIIGKVGSAFLLESVIVHEAGHSWFYGMLGSNERDHGWMDEGINTSNEMRYLLMKYNNDTSKIKNELGDLKFLGALTGLKNLNAKDFDYLQYLYSARNRTDQPNELPSTAFTYTNYGTIMYAKTGLGFHYLRSYLGDSIFDLCMREYFNQWKFKHPYPEDIRKIFADKSGKNLEWFFDDFLKTTKKADYKLSSVQRIYGNSFINPISKGYALKVVNKEELASPFSVSVLKSGRILSTKWYDGFNGKDTINLSCEQCDQFKIDALQDVPEINRKNNSIRTGGMFKSVEKISFPFLFKVENPDRTQITWLPLIGWNNYNKTMVGIAFYNISVINKKFEYIFAPLYSIGTDGLAGSATVNYTMYPCNAIIQRIALTGKISKYGYDDYNFSDDKSDLKLNYVKADGEINFQLKNKNARSSWNKNVKLRNINVWEDYLEYNLDNGPPYELFKSQPYRYHNMLSILLSNKRTLNPYSTKINIEQGKKYVKSSFEFVYRFSYKLRNRGVDVRFYTEGFLLNIDDVSSVHLTGTGNGFVASEDYLYDNLYFGRSENTGIWSQQFYHQAGDFKIYSPIGRNDLWIGTINIKAHFPGRLPFRAYLDIGMFDGSRRVYDDYQGLTYDAGLSLCLIQDVFEIYFPVFHSLDIKKYLEVNDRKYKNQIRFVFNINALSPFKLRESVLTF